jgi:K+/H+ antiporter YhaU regulatory subunit KhtT
MRCDIRRLTGVTILAVLRDGGVLVNPPGELALVAGDQCLALGTRERLQRLERLVSGQVGQVSSR